MNLGQLRTAVNRKTGVAVADEALNQWINEAISAIGNERDWPWLDALESYNSIAGTQAYDLPDDWARTRTVTVNGAPTRRWNVADSDGVNYNDDQGTFYGYTIEAGQMIFNPPPGEVIPILHRYVAVEPELIADSDEPLIPARFHQAIVYYTAADILDRYEPTRADSARAQYGSWLRRMQDAGVRSQQPSRVRIRRGAAW